LKGTFAVLHGDTGVAADSLARTKKPDLQTRCQDTWNPQKIMQVATQAHLLCPEEEVEERRRDLRRAGQSHVGRRLRGSARDCLLIHAGDVLPHMLPCCCETEGCREVVAVSDTAVRQVGVVQDSWLTALLPDVEAMMITGLGSWSTS